ncbi:MAG: VWA domain-containing protein [Phycisphaerae bacterium]|nr:VWA domain-containing protein [Phycisphaerae bacterium]
MEFLSFIHPGIAAAAFAAGALPVLIHFLSRRRFHRVPWAAMRFLRAAYQRSARRLRIENWLLLLLRVAAVLLVGAAVARPFVPAGEVVPERFRRMHRVLILDDSLSMQAVTSSGRTRLELALAFAEEFVDSLPSADGVSLITVSAPARAIIEDASRDRRVVRQVLDTLEPTQRADDLPGALNLARKLLSESDYPSGNRAVYLISDFSGPAWAASKDHARTPASGAGLSSRVLDEVGELAESLSGRLPGLIFVPVGETEENVAITDIHLESPFTAVGLPARLVVRVSNLRERNAEDVALQIRRDEEILRRESLPRIESGGATDVVVGLELPSAGIHVLEASLVNAGEDALVLDNSRRLSVEVRERIPILLVEGQPGRASTTGPAYFLQRALAPQVSPVSVRTGLGDRDKGSFRPVFEVSTISAPELGAEALAEYAAVMLCDVARIPDATWSALTRYVLEGGALALFAGDGVDVPSFNHAVGALLPGRMVPARVISDGESETANDGVTLIVPPRIHPIIVEFAGFPDSGLFQAHVRKYIPLEDVPADDEIVLTLVTGEPLLVVGQRGLGRVMYFGTSADMAWTNLPAYGDFVSLMLSATSFLVPQRGAHRNLECGGVLREPLQPQETSLPLQVRNSNGQLAPIELVADARGVSANFGPVQRAGVLELSVGGDMRRFAANVPATESDLHTRDMSALVEDIGKPITVLNAYSGSNRLATMASKLELATIGLWSALILLIAEMWLAMRFGRKRSRINPPASAPGGLGQ